MFGFLYHKFESPALLYRDRVEFTTDEGVGNLW